MKITLVLFLLCSLVVSASAATTADFPIVVNYSFQNNGTVTVPGRLCQPPQAVANPNQKYPLVIFLHGSLEAGTDNVSQINININNLLLGAKQFGFYLYAPQSTNTTPPVWEDIWRINDVMLVAGQIVRDYNIDPNRVYVTGLSDGGGGTWHTLSDFTNMLAAAVPICGIDNVNGAAVVNKPIWTFHARDDASVNVSSTRNNVNAIRLADPTIGTFAFFPLTDPSYYVYYASYKGTGLPEEGASYYNLRNLIYSEYTTGGHGIWTNAYGEPALYSWLLGQTQLNQATPLTQPAAGEKLLFDFGPTITGSDGSGQLWNSPGGTNSSTLPMEGVGTSTGTEQTIAPAVVFAYTNTGHRTPITLSVTQPFNGISTTGTTSSSIYQASITGEGWEQGNTISNANSIANPAELQLTGLVPSQPYNLKIYGSDNNPNNNCPTRYTIDNSPTTYADLSTQGNVNNYVTLNNVAADANGHIAIEIAPAPSANANAFYANIGALEVAPVSAVTLGNLAATYNGSPHSATATTNPPGLNVTFTYNGSTTAPTNAGSYTVVGTINNATYSGSATGTLVISKAVTTVNLGSLAASYNGLPQAATATTTPSGFNVTFTYNGSSTVPTTAGSYAVVGTINDPNYAGTSTGTLMISQATATVSLGGLADTYTGSPQSATATTTPPGLNITFTYNGSATAPTTVGSYTVVGTINDPNYAGTSTSTLVIGQATATVSLGGLADIYTGLPQSATATTNPPSLNVTFTYNGSATAPSVAGSYTVVGTVNDPNYTGTATATLVISNGSSAVTLGNLTATYNGSPQPATATTNPPGLNVTFTYNGSATAPTSAGSYAVVGTINDATYSGSATGTLVISQATATVNLGSLAATYNGSPQAATATTNPSGLNVTFTYNGSAAVPTNAGSYTVVGTINDPNYAGVSTGALVISKAAATVSLDSLAATYNTSAHAATATTVPAGLTVTYTYNGSATAPTTAGSYTVVGTVNDPNYTGTSTGTLVISKATATVTLGGLAASYNGSPQAATAATVPSGLNVTFTYNGSATAPSALGSYTVVGTVNDPNYTGTATGTLVISKATATVALGGLAASYNGSPQAATATTAPSGLDVNLTYNGSTTAPSAAGSYTVVGTVNDPNYTGTAMGTLVISSGSATVTLGNLTATYNGSPHAATATTAPTGLNVTFTYNGSATAPTNAGSYTVVGTINNATYTGSATGTLVISQATATVNLGSLAATYNGGAHAASATTLPAGLPVTFTYNGSATAPTVAGSYTVVATVNSGDYAGSATGTLVISKATATISLGSLAATYNGTSHSATATTSPVGLNVTFTYNGSVTTPTNAGSYAVVGAINDPNYAGTATGTLVISKATATVSLGGLAHTYTGSPQSTTATTTPSGLNVTYTYNGSATAPTNAGSYTVVGTVSDANYVGTATGTLVVAKGTATVSVTAAPATYDGTAHAATAVTVPAGLPVTLTYNGSATVPINAGTYTVVATVNSPNITGTPTGNGTLVISKATATVTITPSSLTVAYNGQPHAATATTVPTGLTVTFTYNGSATAPTLVGSYTFVATANNTNYTGTTTATLTITPALPIATTGVASLITASSATLNGTVNPNGSATTVSFQWGTSVSYGNTTAGQGVTAGTATVPFSTGISVTPQAAPVIYHYRAVAANASTPALVAYGADKTFATLATPSIAATPQAALGASGAEVNLTVNPNGVATTVYFQYGLTQSYGSTTAMQSLGSGTTPVNVFALFPNLNPSMTYHYRLVMTGPAGTFYGPDQTFTTLGFDTTLVAQKGDAATGTSTTFSSFGNPSVNIDDKVAFTGTLTPATGVTTANNFGIWTVDSSDTQTLIAQIGTVAAGTTGTFLTVSDPVSNDNGAVAFAGTLKVGLGGVTTTTTSGVWSISSGSLQLVARQGFTAPGTVGAFSTFTGLGLSDSGTVILATMNINYAAGITPLNNVGVWEGNSTGDLALKLQTGQVVDGKTISKIALPAETYVNGQTRSFNSAGDFSCEATFSDTTTGLVRVIGGTPHVVLVSGTAADQVPAATYSVFGNPAINNADHMAFAATLTSGVGGVTTANNAGIWADNSTGTRQLIARIGTGAAPGTTANFLTFSDPVYNNNFVVAFRATLTIGVGKATSATATGIWCTSTGSLALVAQQGVTQAPGCPTGATFASFTELALPDQGGATNQGGVVFLATLNTNAAAGVTTTNNLGIWAVDNSGAPQLVVRTGAVLGGKTVTGLSFLPNLTTVGGQSRSFAQGNGDLVYLATFSDGSTGIYNVVF